VFVIKKMSNYEDRPRHDISQGSGRHFTTPTDFGGGHFLDDDDKDGPRNVGLFATEPTDAIASPRIFYVTLMLFRFYADP
jgi:hypothetical protein